LFFFWRSGYVRKTAQLLVLVVWLGITYQAWRADGVRDVVIYAYIAIVLVAALLTNWWVPISISILSVVAIWVLAIVEMRGLRTANIDSPINIARDLTAIFSIIIFMVFLVINTLRQTLDKMQAENLERLRAEQALRERDERFRKIFDLSPVAINVTALKDGRLLEANQAYWQLTGFDPKTALGRTTIELAIWDTEEQRQSFVKRLAVYKSLHNPNYEFINEAGEKHITIAFYELIDSGDEPSVLSMFYDVTDQKQAQVALQRSDEHFRKVFQTSPVAIVITTLAEGRMIDANAAFWKLSGHDPETSIGRTTFEVRKILQTSERDEFVRELLEKRSIQIPLYDFVNDRGEHLKTAAFYELIDEQGAPAILSMFYDITEQNKAQEALVQSEARVRALLEATPDMIFELTRAGTIVQFIPSAENDLFLRRDELLGKTLAQVFPSIADQANFAIGRALDSGQVNAFEYQLPGTAERRDFEVRITPAGSDLVLATIRDVSLRKWAESEREKLINELEAKNAELERFTYTVSHDLKSPLITIKGFLGYVREDVQAGNMTRFESDLRRIGDATEKMQHLLGDLLELSRIGRLTNEPTYIPMNALIAEVLELLHGRIQAGKIVVSVAENLPAVYGDRQRLFEVLQNLIDNAAKFMESQPEPRIEIGVQGELNGNPVFFVRDNGIGIAPQFKDKIFGLFDKLNSQSEGTGIGLALVKRIIEFHGGRIWVESETGHGATFFFSLPTQPVTDEVNK
jgi:PAS domain S-box-containing protein